MGKIKINAKYSYYLIQEYQYWHLPYPHYNFKIFFYKKKYEFTIFNKTIFIIKKLVAIRYCVEINEAFNSCLADIRDLNNMNKNDQPKYVGVMTCKVPK